MVADTTIDTRGLVTVQKWDVEINNKIVVPYTFMDRFGLQQHPKDWAKKRKITTALDDLADDLGCMEFVHVPRDELTTTNFTNGIIFVDGTMAQGCFSVKGILS